MNDQELRNYMLQRLRADDFAQPPKSSKLKTIVSGVLATVLVMGLLQMAYRCQPAQHPTVKPAATKGAKS